MIIGHLGRDPELRYTPSGRPVATFSVATTRGWTNSSGERQEQTEWFNVVAWGNLAEICKQHLHKGKQVYIEGRLQTRAWQDREDNKRYRTELVAQEMIMLGGGSPEALDEGVQEENTDDPGPGEEFPF
jgi:single-strand DNA-binding protein